MNIELEYEQEAAVERGHQFLDELGHVAPALQRKASKLAEAADRARQQLDEAQAQARTEIDGLAHLLAETGRGKGKLDRAEDLLRLATSAAAAVDLAEIACYDAKRLPGTLEMLCHSGILEKHLPAAITALKGEVASGVEQLVAEFKRQNIQPRTFFDRLAERIGWLPGTDQVVSEVESRMK